MILSAEGAKFWYPGMTLLLVTIIAVYAVMFAVPSRLPRSASCLVMAFSVQVAKGLDNALGVKPVDVYDVSTTKLDLGDLMTWLLYPPIGYLFIYAYDRYRVRGIGIAFYVLAWSVMATAYEALAVHFRVFKYKGWQIGYSFLIYFIVQTLTIVIYELAKRGIQAHETTRCHSKPPR